MLATVTPEGAFHGMRRLSSLSADGDLFPIPSASASMVLVWLGPGFLTVLMPSSTDSHTCLQTSCERREAIIESGFRHSSGPALPSVGVLALVLDSWSEVWQPRHHIVTRLGRFFECMWLEPPPSWRAVLRGARPGEVATPDPSAIPGFTVRKAEPWLPKVLRPALVGKIAFDARVRRAHRALRRKGCERVVAYIWRPEFAAAIDAAPFDLACYHIDDEYSFSDDEEPLGPEERRLIARSDRVFIHSPGLLEKKGGINPNTLFVPNGVDFCAHAQPVPEPADLAGIPHPRIGYTGRVKRQLDWSLIERLARRRPDWHLVLVGAHTRHREVARAVSRLSPLSNVHFLGPKSHDVLAEYPQHFDVCIMPYRSTDYAQYIFPMKLHEFLASGSPVVGTRIRSLQDFERVVRLAESDESWLEAIESQLAEVARGGDARRRRRQVARGYDWDDLTATVARSIAIGLGTDVAEALDAKRYG